MSILNELENFAVQRTKRNHYPQECKETIAKAYRTIVNATLVDVFCLMDEESLWVNYHLEKVSELTKDAKVQALPIAVYDEMETGKYSKTLFMGNQESASPANTDIPQASLEDWTTIFTEMISEGYRLSSISEAGISAIISTMLAELGVGSSENPRGARYLPNTIRWRLNHK